jgi:hypothetical protein
LDLLFGRVDAFPGASEPFIKKREKGIAVSQQKLLLKIKFFSFSHKNLGLNPDPDSPKHLDPDLYFCTVNTDLKSDIKNYTVTAFKLMIW